MDRASGAVSAFRLARIAPWLLIGALCTLALHLTFNARYGYQRDELYFIACARQLAWGYVDQPPLIALIAKISLALFGNSVAGLRVVPSVAAGGLVALCGYAAQRAGGGRYATALAMIGVALAPFDVAVGSLLTMNAFEPLFWLGLTLLVWAQIDEPRDWRWLFIGVVVGVGVLNKWSMALYTFALFGGIALSPARRAIFVPSFAAAIMVAAALVAPNIWWQAAHGWPQILVLHNAAVQKNAHVGSAAFLLEQLPLMNPVCAPVWLAGLVGLARSPRYRGLAIAYGVVVGAELTLQGKVYYVAPIYPALIAVGAVLVERATRHGGLRAALAGAIVLGGLAIMPLATPILPLALLLDYQHAIDVRRVKMEDHPIGLVPQQFADQLGWNELTATMSYAVSFLSPAERRSAVILTGDYGQAAALDFLGGHLNLPPAVSGHNQYFVWGPHGDHAAIVAVGVPLDVLAQGFGSIRRVTTYVSPYVLPQNSNLPVYVCRRPRQPLTRWWPQLRRFI